MEDKSDFGQFWIMYPRKHGRGTAVRIWCDMTKEQRALALESIPKHKEYWAKTGRAKDMIPKPENWLRAWSWEDELDMTEEIPQKAVAWWASDEGVTEKGRELSVHPKGGESMAQYKARVVDAARKAA